MSSKAVRQRGRGFAYSVPKFKGSKQRIERTFVLQEEGNRWHADALCAIEAFLPVPEADLYRTTHQQRPQAEHARNPSSTQQERHAPQPMTEKHVGVLIGASNHRFSTVSGEWFHREFVNVPDPKLVAAQNCEQHLRMHLNPYFDALVDDINDITDDHVHGFVLLLAGHVTQQKPSLAGSVTTADFLTAIEAAEFLGCSISKIRVLIKNRKLPNVRYEETRLFGSGCELGLLR